MNYNEAYNYIFNEIGDEGYKLLDLIAEDDTLEGLKFIQEITSCDENTAKLLWVDLKCKYGTEETNPFLEKQEGYLCQADLDYVEKMKNKPKCITCGSTNIKKISTSAKVAGAVAFGLFSKTAKSQFKCENCGCKW